MKIKNIVITLFFATSLFAFVQMTDTNDSIDLGSLYKQLPEIVVKAKKTIVKLEQGKLAYNMPNLLEKYPADNVFDAVKNIPGITRKSNIKRLILHD